MQLMAIYGVPAALIVFRDAASWRKGWRAGSLTNVISIVVHSLGLSALISIILAMSTGHGAFYLCNCYSYTGPVGGGNNHFDEDVMLANFVTIASLMWWIVNSEMHRAQKIANYAFPIIALLTLGAIFCCWSTVVGPPLGCGDF